MLGVVLLWVMIDALSESVTCGHRPEGNKSVPHRMDI